MNTCREDGDRKTLMARPRMPRLEALQPPLRSQQRAEPNRSVFWGRLIVVARQ